MQSLRYLFRYGMGPSSSHTIGPNNAARQFKEKTPQAASYRVHFYGSLSLTGKGHLSDKSVLTAFAPLPCELVWHDEALPFHPNGMKLEALDANGHVIHEWTTYSIGGGELRSEGDADSEHPHIYPQKNMQEVLDWAADTGRPLWQLVEETEEQDFIDVFIADIWVKMQDCISTGLKKEGVLQGGLKLPRKARDFMARAKRLKDDESRTSLLSSYALAVSEENADGGYVVTAPTCGSCGILPSVLFYLFFDRGYSTRCILNALATAGLVGNLVKQNGSISGAEVGCQGEVGVACAMAAAAAAQIMGGSPAQIEYAAEMALEHHLGLTCDPVLGLVQVPCIERNAFAAVKAIACAEYAMLGDGKHLVSFDKVVKTMQKTGHDMLHLYRETSLGGLAISFFEKH